MIEQSLREDWNNSMHIRSLVLSASIVSRKRVLLTKLPSVTLQTTQVEFVSLLDTASSTAVNVDTGTNLFNVYIVVGRPKFKQVYIVQVISFFLLSHELFWDEIYADSEIK